MIKSGDTISLSGNEYVKIDPGYYKNVTYEIEKIENGLHHTEKMTSGSVDATRGNGARFTRNIEDTAKRTIFKPGETYVLMEETVFANGDSLPTNKISTILGQSVNVEGIAAADRKTKVMISKTEIGGGKELPGCEMELYDEENNLIHSWTSSDVAESLEEFLEPGKTYRLVEKSPAPGYSYAEDVTFTVNEDGTVDRVIMVDKPTHIVLSKKKITNSEELPGALLQVVDKDGNVVEEWISTDQPHEIVAKLVVDESYVLREVRPADGWAYAEDVPFKVSHDGTVDYVKMEDKPTHVVISKQEITGSKELPGCTLQVIDKNGNVVENDRTEWSYGRFGIFQGYGSSFSYTFNNETWKKWKEKLSGTKDADKEKDKENSSEEGEDAEASSDESGIPKKKVEKAAVDADGYQVFKMPWSLNFNYSFNISEDRSKPINRKKMRYPYRYTHNLSASGNIKLSNKWAVSFNSGYDFEAKKIVQTTFNITRDLHCFSMSASLSPFGQWKYYNFTIRANASILQDLKWEQRSQTQSNIQWY